MSSERGHVEYALVYIYRWFLNNGSSMEKVFEAKSIILSVFVHRNVYPSIFDANSRAQVMDEW